MMKFILASSVLLLGGCALKQPSREQLLHRINELDTENVRLLKENNRLLADNADCIAKTKAFNGILGNTLRLQREAEERVKKGRSK